MKPREVTRAIEAKVPGDTHSGHEQNRWAVLDGKKVLRVTYPKQHASDIKKGTLNSIRKQLRLDQSQFERFVDCSMSGSEYTEHIRSILSPTPDENEGEA